MDIKYDCLMDKNQIFEFIKEEKNKGIDNSVIRTILLAKEYFATDIDEVMEIFENQKNLPKEQQINPFLEDHQVKKIFWENVLALVVLQVGIVFASKLSLIKQCVLKSNTNITCSLYSILLIAFFVLPIIAWIIKFFFRKRKIYTLLIGTIISIIILTIISLTK